MVGSAGTGVGGIAVAVGGSTGFWYGLLVALGSIVEVRISVGTSVSVGNAVAVSAGSGVKVSAGFAVVVGGTFVGSGVNEGAVVALGRIVFVVVRLGVFVDVSVAVFGFAVSAAETSV